MLGHLGRRGLASWPIWVGAAVALTAWAAIRSARSGFVHEVTVVLRVSEGSARASGSELTVGSLRAHVDDLALTNSRLVELMRRHPGAFSELEKDPAGALEELRGHMEVSISENDFIEERSPSDPPRSARIALSFRSPNPELAWTVDHELAELVIGSTLEHQRAALSRARAAAAAAVKQAEAHADGVVSPAATPSAEGVVPVERGSTSGAFLRKAGEGAAAAELSLRAAEEQQALRFEMVDPGRVPTRPPRGGRPGAGSWPGPWRWRGSSRARSIPGFSTPGTWRL